MATFFVRRALALSLAAVSVSCGPVGATSLINDAEVATARAHAADGDRYAIYETTSADLYLQKAREEQGRARYEEAMALARESVAFADQAEQKARSQRSSGVAPVAPRATIQHDAGGAVSAPVSPAPEETPK